MTVDEMISKFANANLIPSVNPQIAEKTGMGRMLKYRMDKNAIEIDSCPLVRKGFIFCYGKEIGSCSDTTLNMLNPLKSFSIYRLKSIGGDAYPFEKSSDGRWQIREDILELIYNKENDIFYACGELRQLFDEAADRQYSFANMVPVPYKYNGYKYRFGKGSYLDNNDYPYFYYRNLIDRGDSVILPWLNDNIDKLHLRASYKLQPPFSSPTEYYSEEKYDALKEYLQSAIAVINDRARWIEGGCKQCKS